MLVLHVALPECGGVGAQYREQEMSGFMQGLGL